MRAAVGGDDPVLIAPAAGRRTDIQKDQLLGRLYNLVRRTHARNAPWHASVGGIRLVPILIELLNLFPELRFVERLVGVGSPRQGAGSRKVDHGPFPWRQVS